MLQVACCLLLADHLRAARRCQLAQLVVMPIDDLAVRSALLLPARRDDIFGRADLRHAVHRSPDPGAESQSSLIMHHYYSSPMILVTHGRAHPRGRGSNKDLAPVCVCEDTWLVAWWLTTCASRSRGGVHMSHQASSLLNACRQWARQRRQF